jgi:O-antigen/teichoic acid export membrane protein
MSVSRNTAFNLVGAVVPIVLALVTVPLYLHAIGADRYGVLAIAWLLLGYFGLFDLGLGRATTYRLAALSGEEPAAHARVFWTAVVVNIGMGLVGAVVLWAASAYFFEAVFKIPADLRREVIASAPYLAASVPIATLTGVLTGALQARQRFFEMNMVSILSTTLFQVFPLLVAWFVGPSLPLLLASAVAARLLAILVLWWQCHRYVIAEAPKPVFDRSEVKTLLSYGGWVTVTGLFGPLLVILDRFAIGAIIGATAVTIYTVPFQLAQRLTILPNALVNALFPRLPSASVEERERIAERALRVLLPIVTPPVLFGIFALYPFMDLWIGKELGRQAAEVGGLILLGFWANSLGIFAYVAMQASGRPDLVTKILLVEIPPYLILLYFAMTWFGIIGCAAVFALRCAADSALMTWVAFRRFHGLNLLGAALIPLIAAIGLAARFHYDQTAWWAIFALAMALVVLFCWIIAPDELKNPVISRWVRLRGAS